MLIEQRALLDHAHRCRRIARESEHARATERLIEMAREYEVRAATLFDEERKRAKDLDRYHSNDHDEGRFKKLAREHRPQDLSRDGANSSFRSG